MNILPVLDLQAGLVVRGIAGRRQEYRPLTPECHPIRVACFFRDQFGLEELYLADLDAIEGKPPALDLFANLRRIGFRLWVDAGVADASSAEALFASGIETVVVGLETVAGPGALEAMCDAHPTRIVFSLDLKEGDPLGTVTAWHRPDARSIAEQAIQLGVSRVLLLDLADIGMNNGPGTEVLASELLAANPDLEVAIGGGVRDITDLDRLKRMGIRAALIASALHDGRLRREDLAGLG